MAQQSLLCQLRTKLLLFLSHWWLDVFMGLIRCPKLHILFVDMFTEMKMSFTNEENEVENSGVVFNSFRNALTEF